jgi:predicted Zn-dependent protease
VTAAPGDTIQTMAERMVVPNRPMEYFALLNGLQDPEPLSPGEKYKVITE